MFTHTPDAGMEIRTLIWKDDSFKMSDQTMGWMDTQIPVSPSLYQTITFDDGVIQTKGPYQGLVYSDITTNGDELTLPYPWKTQYQPTAQKNFINSISSNLISLIRIRAGVLPVASPSDSTLTINLLGSDFSTVVGTANVSLVYNTARSGSYMTPYMWFSLSITASTDVYGVQLSADFGAVVDYIAFASDDYLNEGGSALTIDINKKTISQSIPNALDIIQQLGISSRSLAVTIPKVTRDVYDWLEDKLINNIPLEFVTPTNQATGFLSTVSASTEAGWVSSVPECTTIIYQLYDITCTLVKGDTDYDFL